MSCDCDELSLRNDMKRLTATRFYIELSREYPLRCGNPLEATNLLRECVRAGVRVYVSVCVRACVFVWHQKLCSSHCQSQITNDTNSPRALTISTLARSPSLHGTHTHTHTHSGIHARTQSFTHSAATHSLAHAH